MRILRGMISLVAAMAMSAPACAAILAAGQGTVLVNRGNGYQKVQGVTEVKPGDVITVDPSGSAQLTYPDGCTVPVQVGTLVTVSEESPCATQSANTPQTIPGLGGVGIFALNAGIAAGVVGILLSNQGSDKSASP